MTSPAGHKRGFPLLPVVGLAGLVLAAGTGIGLVQAANSSTVDRVKPSTGAPVYGSR